MNRRITALALLLLGWLSLAACQPTSETATVHQTPAKPSPTATQASPPLVNAVDVTPTNLPSFAPLHKEDTAEAVSGEPEPAANDTVTVEVEDAAPTENSEPDQPADDGEAQATPEPTFTPPAQPETSDNDHYWLQRPVAAGGIVWTDKHYPYAGTRGGQLRPHHGVEFNVPYSSEILAANSGTVIVAGNDREIAYGPHTDFYGNLVIIEHDFQYNGQPVYTLYGHLNEVLVSEGSAVASQQVLGLSGATGVADGPHMHFEVRVGSNSYDATRNPLLWLYPFPGNGTVAGRVTWPNGDVVEGAPVSLNRIDGASPYYGTTTYTGNSVNADDVWNENFAIDDVVAGYYQVVVRAGDERYTTETWVYPYRTSFVEITLD
ncbi:MAG TPA: peptidoglycan DD-metalloendopeptidase family protein [Candidatus Sulfomarinibacteraceae bacterium]|nr:peptidoglycan DD-metalloendopeptidase family protein [Candidatus Sulfomarinibacteraceae bacterium]